MTDNRLKKIMEKPHDARARLEDFEPSEAALRSAKDWLIRLREQDLVTSKAFEAWLDANPEHVYAFAEIEKLFNESAVPARNAVYFPQRRRLRLPWRIPLAAMAACAVGLLAAPHLYMLRFITADAVAMAGSTREVRLADGTHVTLNSRSAIRTDLEPGSRHVDLLDGEAFFDVAHDAARPFIVAAGDARIRVLGTQFNVRMEGDQVIVSVTRGLVRVSPVDQPSRALNLHAGEEAVVNDMRSQARVFDPLVTNAWREKQVIFVQTPLRTVVRELNRYRSAPIILINTSLANKNVTAALSTDEPDAAVHIIDRLIGSESVNLITGHTLLY
jgi:transmembrane sensor